MLLGLAATYALVTAVVIIGGDGAIAGAVVAIGDADSVRGFQLWFAGWCPWRRKQRHHNTRGHNEQRKLVNKMPRTNAPPGRREICGRETTHLHTARAIFGLAD